MGQTSNLPTITDIFYIQGILVLFVTVNFIKSNILYFIFPILFWSLYQDWHSAQIADQIAEKVPYPYSLILNLLNILTVGNYVSLFIALTLPPHTKLGYSEFVWLHWGIIFVIYIIWNFIMMHISNKTSRRFFLIYAVIAILCALYCLLIFVETKTTLIFRSINYNIIRYPIRLLVFFAIAHCIILSYWGYQTYYPDSASEEKFLY